MDDDLKKLKRSLHLQYTLGRLAVFILAPFVYFCVRIFGYRVRNLRAIRRKFGLLFKEHSGPWIICANHLTNIDSVILAYAIAPMHRYMMQYSILPWNLPERANFQRNIFAALMCYLVKCVPVSRGGDRGEMRLVLERCIHLLRCGQNLLVFPEGGRSRTGKVDTENFSYGVGRFISNCEDCKILCIYMRGDGQYSYSTIPKLGERFSISADVLVPEIAEQNRLRDQRYYAEKIINRLAQMEEVYFVARRQRHSGLNASQCQGEEQGLTFPETRISS